MSCETVSTAFTPASGGAGAFAPEPLPAAGAFRRAGEAPWRPESPPAAAPPAPALDVEAMRRAAWEEGERAGRGALPWQEADALRAATDALAAAACELGALRRAYLTENRRLVIELACAIAERVLGLPPAPQDLLAALVDRAVELFPPDEPLALHVCAADRATLGAGPQGATLERDGRLVLVTDATLAPGEARVVGRSGDVRAVVADVLERVRAELADAPSTAPELGASTPAPEPVP
ncbi:MAG: hypothetical protein OZ948_06665 [Deltaproteobacteria bacterium]|nr:hypothetical protein [Deltaproteobacteria bacterium]